MCGQFTVVKARILKEIMHIDMLLDHVGINL